MHLTLSLEEDVMKALRSFGLRLTIMAAALAAVFVGCSSDSNSTGSGGGNTRSHFKEVAIQGSSFTPSSLTIAVGDTVLWTNRDGVNHTVTSNTGTELNSPMLSNGETYQHIFNTNGTFGYHCTVHPGMAGTVSVP